MKIKSLKDSVALHLILIAILGILAYSNTFDVPFYFILITVLGILARVEIGELLDYQGQDYHERWAANLRT